MLDNNRMSVEPKISPPRISDRLETDGPELYKRKRVSDRLSVKKLNDLLTNRKIQPERLRSDYPSVS
jgi:hypothetical protein